MSIDGGMRGLGNEEVHDAKQGRWRWEHKDERIVVDIDARHVRCRFHSRKFGSVPVGGIDRVSNALYGLKLSDQALKGESADGFMLGTTTLPRYHSLETGRLGPCQDEPVQAGSHRPGVAS